MKNVNGKQLDQKILLSLIDDGLKGDTDGFEMRVRRLANSLRKSSPDLARKINSRLSGTRSLLRDANVAVNGTQVEPVDADSRLKLVTTEYPINLEDKPIWSDSIEEKIEQIINERIHIEELLSQGLYPIKSVLMEGPPGVGKTLTAKWIASKLDYPLVTLDLATVMSSYLGKTGNNIRSVLDYATQFPCVLLLDEFDAIAKRRDDDTDVGELKRLVTVLLQSVDEWPISSILIAATNHGELLDRAIWRRFDSVINFSNPRKLEIKKFLVSKSLDEKTADWIAKEVEKNPYSLIEKKYFQAKKNSILTKKPFIDEFLNQLGIEGKYYSEDAKESRNHKIWSLHSRGLSQRKIADELGISRPTVSKVIKYFEKGG